ncbi:FAD-dependent oxidoreductase, partial [Candidatus Woesearchaeota archaeon]|nr:FAD-dependent oxidoreductase [Candidatus Woesearchaeota archaeon]
MTKFISSVINVRNIASNTILLSLTTPLEFTFQAGQFIILYINNGLETKPRAYSILSPPHKKEKIDLCFKLVENGFASAVFSKTKIGDKFEMSGPFGNLLLQLDKKKEIEHVFIATGTGVVPFYSMLQEYVYNGKASLLKQKFHLILGLRYKKDIFLEEEWSLLQKKEPNFKLDIVLSREQWPGKCGHVQQHLPENLSNKIFYLCGSGAMI